MRRFACHGFRGTTTRAVARDCRINEALLFRHFPSKRALYRAILDRHLAIPVEEVFPPPRAFRGNDQAFLSAVADALLKRMESTPLFKRILLYSVLEGEAMGQALVDRRLKRALTHLAGYIALRRRQGAFRVSNPHIAARAFVGMVVYHGLLSDLFKLPAPGSPGRATLVDTWVGLFLNGIRKRSR